MQQTAAHCSHQTLVEENMKLVLFVVRKYALPHNFDDLVQEGNIGLIKAAETFDESKGAFSTWAIVHIKAAIFSVLSDKSRMIRIPRNIIPAVLKMKNEISSFETDDSAKPDELKIAALKEIANQSFVSLDEARYAEGPCWGDTLEDRSAISPYVASAESQLKSTLREIIVDALSQREQRVIILRFGLQDGVERSLTEIGKLLGASVASVRSIEATALRKLRNPKSSNRVRGLSIFAPVHP